MDEEFDKQNMLIAKKQERCSHTSWKCTCCELHKDHYKTAEQKYIIELESKIREYEAVLTSLSFCFTEHIPQSNNGIIKISTVRISITDTKAEPNEHLVEERL